MNSTSADVNGDIFEKTLSRLTDKRLKKIQIIQILKILNELNLTLCPIFSFHRFFSLC